jgi:hypothetical protein
MKTAGTMLLGAIVLVAAMWLGLCYYLGVWPLDMFTRKATVLCSAESPKGGRFLVAQYWNGYDFYTTQLEEFAPDGMMRVRVIDGDDRKQKQCQIQLLEEEETVVITLGDGSAPIRYEWNEKKFVMPPGRGRLRD